MQLRDAVVVVTGGTGGLGQRICHAFAREGARVAIVYQQSDDKAKALAEELKAAGGSGRPYRCDVTNLAELEALVERVVADMGRLDVLVNNAAYNQFVAFEDTDALTPEIWEKILHYDHNAPYYFSRAAARPMRKQGQGRIVNISSVAGLRPSGSSVAYAVAKAGLIHLTHCLARALGPEISVNCVAPGTMEGTRMTSRLPESMVEADRQTAWLKHVADKDDVAAQIVAFAKSDSTTGQTVVIDGGGLAH